MSQAKSIYICENCGKEVLPENYYGSGRFCCSKCAKSYSSKFANTEEKRKQKSNTILNKKPVLKYCLKCGCEVYVNPTNSHPICDECKLKINLSIKSPSKKLFINLQSGTKKYDKIINDIKILSENYNFKDISNILQISSKQIKRICKLYNIEENKNFIPLDYRAIIYFCKKVLDTNKSITVDMYNQVRNIIMKKIFEENYTYIQIKEKYDLKYTEKMMHYLISIPMNINKEEYEKEDNYCMYDVNMDKQRYRKECGFRFSLDTFKKIEGFNLLIEYGAYNVKTNVNGVSRDHMLSVDYGYKNSIPPEIIRHPANCKIMFHKENSIKNFKSSITYEELLQRINVWNEKYGVYNDVITEEIQ